MTPIHLIGIIDRMDRSDISCGKLVFKRLLLVQKFTTQWYKLSIFCSLHATCLGKLLIDKTCVYTFFATVKLPIKFLKVLSKFHWKII